MSLYIGQEVCTFRIVHRESEVRGLMPHDWETVQARVISLDGARVCLVDNTGEVIFRPVGIVFKDWEGPIAVETELGIENSWDDGALDKIIAYWNTAEQKATEARAAQLASQESSP